MIDPTPTRITDRPELPPRVEPMPSGSAWGWAVFIVVCIAVEIVVSAWAIWESVR